MSQTVLQTGTEDVQSQDLRLTLPVEVEGASLPKTLSKVFIPCPSLLENNAVTSDISTILHLNWMATGLSLGLKSQATCETLHTAISSLQWHTPLGPLTTAIFLQWGQRSRIC